MNRNKTLLYLASPYSHDDATVREERFKQVCKKAAEIMLDGKYNVFCPIAHSHPIEWYGMDERQSGDFWIEQDLAVLRHCDELWIYMMPGFKESKGIDYEVSFAIDNNIPVSYVE